MLNNTNLYRQRRKDLIARTGDAPILISASEMSPDTALRDKNLAYLTGVHSASAYLLLVPQGIGVEPIETSGGPELMQGHEVHEILFVEGPSPEEIFMSGPGKPFESIQEGSGVDRVYDLSRLNRLLQAVLMRTDVLWVNTPSAPPLAQPLSPGLSLINKIRERFYWVQLKNVATIIHQMRFVKDDFEIVSLREAFEIQTAIFQKVMRSLKPGESERLGQIIFDHEIHSRPTYVSPGMDRSSYESTLIVGSGKNATIPHYMNADKIIQDGDLVLIDSGVAVNGYCSDITRTFPANGRFTPRQRELYSMVLEAENAAIETMKPGSTMLVAHQVVYDTFKKYGVERYSYGNCGHPVGLNIHDANGRYPGDREQPFEPGVVVVIEPFLMIHEEGIGIRIEDGVLITQNGHEVLAGPAREINAVEALCNREA